MRDVPTPGLIPMSTGIVVEFIDTSVLVELLAVPGKSQRSEATLDELRRKTDTGRYRFVIPVSAIIEAGNFVAQAPGDRRRTADRFQKMVMAAKRQDPPWIIRDILWGEQFLQAILDGDSTGTDLLTHFTNKTLGTGDLAILVERDEFRRDTAFTDVRIWTLDDKLAAYAG